jgi:8-oxo-dGTP pyrophosphatase MutT (NUDIX family)
MNPFQRHIDACNSLGATEGLLPFSIAGQQVGWLGPDLARALTFFPREMHFDATGASLAGRLRSPAARGEALAGIARALAGRGHFTLRDEPFDVRATPEGPVLATLDRGALPAFGIRAAGVHVNGRVMRPDGLHLWMGWRSRHKAVAPGKLDNLVAGGIPAGLDEQTTLLKEAGEEASLPPGLARQARRVGRVSYAMRAEGGVRRDLLHCFDLDLPEGFEPRPNDDEVERFELWPIRRVLEAVRDTDDVKFNVNLVLIDLFLREGLIDPDGAAGRALRAGLDQGG